MEDYNNILMENNQKLRIEKYTRKYCILSGIGEIQSNIITKFMIKKIKIRYFDDYFLGDSAKKLEITTKVRKIACFLNGKKAKSSKGIKTGKIPWNKGIKIQSPNWNKGKTKHDNEAVMRISLSKIGKLNPNYGKSPSMETRKKQSNSIKNKILLGEFTPNIMNSNTHFTSEVFNKKFRSSWECAFYYVNQHLLYEKIRIPYYCEEKSKNRIYISDFLDYSEKIIYEIKPKIHIIKQKNKLDKIIDWCKLNGYKFILKTEDDIKEIVKNFTDIDYSNFDKNTERLLKSIR